MAIGSRTRPAPLELVERGEAVAVLVLVDVEDVRARRPGRDAEVESRLGPPPLLDLLVVGGRVEEAVLASRAASRPARRGRRASLRRRSGARRPPARRGGSPGTPARDRGPLVTAAVFPAAVHDVREPGPHAGQPAVVPGEGTGQARPVAVIDTVPLRLQVPEFPQCGRVPGPAVVEDLARGSRGKSPAGARQRTFVSRRSWASYSVLAQPEPDRCGHARRLVLPRRDVVLHGCATLGQVSGYASRAC